MPSSRAVQGEMMMEIPLRKHAHAIYRDFFICKSRKFHLKEFDIFNIFAQNIDFLWVHVTIYVLE